MKLLLLTCAGSILLACGCISSDPPARPAPAAVTDTRPLGDGLKTIAFALLGASVVFTLGRLLR